MRSYPVSVQLYSVRDAAKNDFPGVLKKIAEMGYIGVEFAGFHGHSPGELRSMLDDLGLIASSCHGPLPTRDNLQEIADAAHEIGYAYHISGFGKDHFVTCDDCFRAADILQQCAELLSEEGLRFGIHNHWWEFDHLIDGKTPHEIVMERAPDVFAQIDTYWVKVGGCDPATVVGRLGKKLPLLHIKDGPLVREQAMMAVGDGKMDWKPILEAADPASLEWLIVELDRCDTDMFVAVERSLKYLVDTGYGKANG